MHAPSDAHRVLTTCNSRCGYFKGYTPRKEISLTITSWNRLESQSPHYSNAVELRRASGQLIYASPVSDLYCARLLETRYSPVAEWCDLFVAHQRHPTQAGHRAYLLTVAPPGANV